MDADARIPQNDYNNNGRGQQQWRQRHTTSQPKRTSHRPPAVGGPGTQAIFLVSGVGSSAGRTSHGGTGFFLPRRPETTDFHLHHRPVCSTALLPSRVVHALNRGLHSVPSSNGSVDHVQAGAMNKSVENERSTGYNKRNIELTAGTTTDTRSAPCSPCPEALCLPNEWTY